MPFSLTATDLVAIPSGVTATVSGSLGATVTVYWLQVTWLPTQWAVGGTRTGDGSLTVSLPVGQYWLYAATGTAVTSVVWTQVTNGQLSVADQIGEQVIATLKLLNLPEIAGNVYQQLSEDDVEVETYPAALVLIADEHEEEDPMTFFADRSIYPYHITIVDEAIQAFDQTRLPVYRSWRQAIRRSFENQPILTIPYAFQCDIHLGPIGKMPENTDYPRRVSEITLLVYVEEPRGIGS